MPAKPEGMGGGHPAPDAKGTRFVGCRRHHAPMAAPTHKDGFTAQNGVLPLLDGGKEGVHVHMEDLSGVCSHFVPPDDITVLVKIRTHIQRTD